MTPVERSDEARPAPAPAEGPAAPAAPAEPPPPAGAAGRVAEWFLRRRAIARVTAHAPLSGEQLEMIRRASAPLELAERALDPVEPLVAGDGAPAALGLCREAVYWLLRALAPAGSPPPLSLAEAFDLAPAELVREAAGGDEAAAALREALAAETFVESAERPPELARASARAAVEFAHGLHARLEGRNKFALERLLWQRALRVAAALVVVVSVAFGVGLGVRAMLRPPDIARGAAWRASSAYTGYVTAGNLPHSPEDIFFHTAEDKEPWLEVDLGAPRRVSSVFVENRIDYGQERAVPLVVELSEDGETWAEVARQPTTFRTWTASFAARPARYVRLRVPRRTFLHLRRVSVYDR
ncbi:MAG TPA: discoidin domain-containing protein [Polyangiaceae bacterium]|nr:discoidin domain-containing protein [Polyangiaceae bacterium]